MKGKNTLESNVTIRAFDATLSVLLMALLMPVWLANWLMSLTCSKDKIERIFHRDDLGRGVVIRHWRFGYLKNSLVLMDICSGALSFCGVEYHNATSLFGTNRTSCLRPSLFSLYGLQKKVGYIAQSPEQSLAYHEQNNSLKLHVSILIKAILCSLLYSGKNLKDENKFKLFGLTIDNITVNDALQKLKCHAHDSCKKMVFINVNSINQADADPRLIHIINRADIRLVDGSGVRLGAKMQGIALRDNINGTDFLPHFCKMIIAEGKSVYLLGAAPDVVEQAAYNLKTAYGSIAIAGYQHGYFSDEDNESIIEKINASGADFVLVAMGSPNQERWIDENAHKLKAKYAIAVGGLFDFVAERIPRAPQWMREIGMEWIFRLLQEPRSKFKRYVIGNPAFMARCMVQKMAMKNVIKV